MTQRPLSVLHDALLASLHGSVSRAKPPTPQELNVIRKYLADCGQRPDLSDPKQAALVRELGSMYLAAVCAAMRGPKRATSAVLMEVRHALEWLGVTSLPVAESADSSSPSADAADAPLPFTGTNKAPDGTH